MNFILITDECFISPTNVFLTRHSFDGRIDPCDIIGYTSVDAWRTSTSATDTEANHTLESVSFGTFEDEWSTGISLASVFATLTITGAQHSVLIDTDTLASVLSSARGVAEGWDTDLHQDVRCIVTTLSGQAPSGNGSLGALSDRFSLFGQTSRLNVGVEGEWFGQGDDSDIMHGRVSIVTLMSYDAGWTRDLDVGRTVMIVGTGYDAVWVSVSDAMGGRDHNVGRDQGTTAKMAFTHL